MIKERKRREKEGLGIEDLVEIMPERKKEAPSMTMKLLGIGLNEKIKPAVRLSWQLQPQKSDNMLNNNISATNHDMASL